MKKESIEGFMGGVAWKGVGEIGWEVRLNRN